MAAPNTAPTYQFLDGTNADGTVLGQTSTSLVGFYGTTPVRQGTTALATVASTAAVISSSASAWCYNSSAQADGIVTALNLLVRMCVSNGLSK